MDQLFVPASEDKAYPDALLRPTAMPHTLVPLAIFAHVYCNLENEDRRRATCCSLEASLTNSTKNKLTVAQATKLASLELDSNVSSSHKFTMFKDFFAVASKVLRYVPALGNILLV